MHTYGVYEAKTKLAELLKQVQRGERVTITNRGQPIAELVPSERVSGDLVREAITAIRSARAGRISQSEFAEMRLRGRR